LFFILLTLAFYLVFKVFYPYIYTLLIAVIFAVAFTPLHKKIKSILPKHDVLSSLVTVGFVILIVLAPLSFFGIQLSDEVRNLYSNSINSIENGNLIERVTDTANRVVKTLSPIKYEREVFATEDTENYILNLLAWIQGNFGYIFSGLAKFFVNFFIFILAFYYFIKDGEHLKKALIDLSPFNDMRDEEILKKLGVAIMSIAKGSILIAFIQGALSMAGFSIFGVPSPVLWGGIATVAALIPGLGTSLVFLPVILFMLFIGETGSAVGLLIWGIVAVGLIDNFLGPKLVGKGIKIHSVLILISALGGIAFFGPLGFIFGPITLSFLFTLLEIYRTIIVKDNQ
jgi:predicted PurR-regulated permease PerM